MGLTDDWLDMQALVTAVRREDREAIDAILDAGDVRSIALCAATCLAAIAENDHGDVESVAARQPWAFHADAHSDEYRTG